MNKVRFSLCREDIIYRIFGLFPYYDKNENEEFILHKATENVDGCYDKISCSFKLPSNIELEINGTSLLIQGEVYSYKTLQHIYYRYKSILSTDNSFIMFMERGMGRTKVNKKEGWVLVPDYVNIVECEDLLKNLLTLKRRIDNYWNDGDKVDCDIECIEKEFEQKGGEDMITFYRELLEAREEISSEYYTYATNEDGIPYNTTIDFNINFVGNYKDLGIAESYIDLGSDREIKNWLDIKGNGYKEDATIKATSNSLLTNFRQFTDYVSSNSENENGKILSPTEGTDWLFYYKKGYIGDYDVAIDGDGNISMQKDCERNATLNSYDLNLEAYGDVLINITQDTNKHTVTFEYVMGAHLKAQLVSMEADEFNKIHYCYGDFEYDDEDKYHGVVYTETYPYNINEWVDDETFDKMINGEKIGSGNNKGVFILTGNLISSKADFDGDMDYSYIAADYETIISKEKDYIMVSPIIRADYYIGITHEPIIKNNVRFSRGNAAAFERHIKLGEVKSFDDLENYSNGGFFNAV